MKDRVEGRSKFKPVLPIFERVVSAGTQENCYRLTNQHVAVLLRVVKQFLWITRWDKEAGGQLTDSEFSQAQEIAETLILALIKPENCGGGDKPEHPVERPIIPIYDYQEGSDFWDLNEALEWLIEEFGYESLLEELDVSCKCPEFKFIGGVLHQSYIDDCNCKKWKPVPSEGRAGGSGIGAAGAAGASLGASLLDDEGNPTGTTIPIDEPDLINRAQDKALRACSKATYFVNFVTYTMSATLDSTLYNMLLTVIPTPIIDAASVLAPFFPAAYSTTISAVKVLNVIKKALNTEGLRDDIQGFLGSPENIENAICELSQVISDGYEITGEDLTNAALAFGEAGSAIYRFVLDSYFTINPRSVSESLSLFMSETTNCGCPEIGSSDAAGTLPLNPPIGATWAVEADFTLGTFGTSILDSFGVYQAGVGYNYELIDQNGNTNSSSLLKVEYEANTQTRWLRIDYLLEGVVQGQFANEPATPNNDIEIFAVHVETNNSFSLGENGNGWHTVQLGSNANFFRLLFLFGYQETSPVPPNTGRGTLKKIRLYGTGTKPTDFDTDGWADIS